MTDNANVPETAETAETAEADPTRASALNMIEHWAHFVGNHATQLGAGYDSVRDTCPIGWFNKEDIGSLSGWYAFDHDLVVAITRDHQSFSNVTNLFGGDFQGKPLACDPPEHTAYRRTLNRFFLGQRITALEDEIRADVGRLLTPILERGSGDIVTDLATPLPARTFCRICGIPEADMDEVMAAEERLFAPGFLARTPEEAMAAAAPLIEYLLGLIARRREEPTDDVVGALVSEEVNGALLDDFGVLEVVFLLVGAGHRTTQDAIASAVLLLASDPVLQKRLRDQPDLVPTAVDEFLRVAPSVAFMPRVATADTEVAGQRIRAGDMVYPVFGSANHDPTAFPDPHVIDPARDPNRHFTFGRGIHQCLGASLARLEMRIVVEGLLTSTESLTLADDAQRGDWPDYGIETLPILVRPVVNS